jgi:hypothetical protein
MDTGGERLSKRFDTYGHPDVVRLLSSQSDSQESAQRIVEALHNLGELDGHPR